MNASKQHIQPSCSAYLLGTPSGRRACNRRTFCTHKESARRLFRNLWRAALQCPWALRPPRPLNITGSGYDSAKAVAVLNHGWRQSVRQWLGYEEIARFGPALRGRQSRRGSTGKRLCSGGLAAARWLWRLWRLPITAMRGMPECLADRIERARITPAHPVSLRHNA